MHLAPGHWAGHMRIYHRGCMSLAHAGYRVELIAHSLNGQLLDPAIKLHSLGSYGKSTLSWRIAQRISRCREAYSLARSSNATIFHHYSPEFIPWARRLRRSTGRPVIFDCMEDFEAYCYQRGGIPNFLRGTAAHAVRRLLRVAAHSSDAVVVADEGTAKTFEGHARRVLILHNFPELALFPDELTSQKTHAYDVVYHGSLPRYHLKAFLAIDDALLERGRSVHWRLIGNIADLKWFSQELQRRGIAGRFHLSGLIPHDRIAAEICKAKIGVIPLPSLPKFQNNIPQKLFEFMALGMPAILSDLPPSRPFVGDGACAIMVGPDDYRGYADAIIGLLDDSPLRQRMGLEGRRRVKEQYNWEKESNKLIALYREILG